MYDNKKKNTKKTEINMTAIIKKSSTRKHKKTTNT